MMGETNGDALSGWTDLGGGLATRPSKRAEVQITKADDDDC